MSLSNGASYQTIKPWAPGSYSRCLEWPPSISKQTVVCLTAFYHTHLNMLASAVVTVSWSLATRTSMSCEEPHERDLPSVPTGKRSLEFDPVTEEARQSAFEFQSNSWVFHICSLQDIFHILRWSSVMLKPQPLPHCYRGTSSSSPNNTVCRKSWYLLSVSMLGNS
jgi:hypothetical protein